MNSTTPASTVEAVKFRTFTCNWRARETRVSTSPRRGRTRLDATWSNVQAYFQLLELRQRQKRKLRNPLSFSCSGFQRRTPRESVIPLHRESDFFLNNFSLRSWSKWASALNFWYWAQKSVPRNPNKQGLHTLFPFCFHLIFSFTSVCSYALMTCRCSSAAQKYSGLLLCVLRHSSSWATFLVMIAPITILTIHYHGAKLFRT